MNRVILFAAQIKRLFPPRWTLVLLIRRAVLRGLVKLNRCVRSLKLYVVANTHAYLPQDIHARETASIREVPRVFWIKTFVSTGLPRTRPLLLLYSVTLHFLLNDVICL